MVTMTESGQCAFRVYLPHAGDVQLLGSFAAWQDAPIPMSRDGGGWWTAQAVVSTGEHEFCYLVDGELWMPDYAASGIRRNSAGNWISLLYIPEFSPGPEPDRPAGATAEPRGARHPQSEPRTSAHGRDLNNEAPSAARRSGADARAR